MPRHRSVPRPAEAPPPDPPGDASPFDMPGMLVPADTRTRLLQAAMAEFIESGFAGTDTNRIARRAGFAPQTFYRWFADKTAVFIEVLHVWEEVEAAMLRSVLETPEVDAATMAASCVQCVKPFLTFRRNLRNVTANDPAIRTVRAQGRRRLLSALACLRPASSPEELGSLIVQFEQLCEALAQGELQDMGLADDAAMADLARLVDRLRGTPP